jgi:cellulose synthase/poly-beta-1,6-N-acetylglucosamine synthase-like glycosyltransferase
MEQLSYLNFILAIIFVACYSYQIAYTVLALVKKQKKYTAKKNHKYAVIISARNEENVISQLINSVRWQKYPAELIDIFVVADNCTDNTAEICRKMGANVYERFNQINVGKGYALDYLFSKIKEDHINDGYEGFVVFDADNIIDENFFTEINKIYDTGKYVAITSYRNSKNYSDNWVASGSSLWFLREAKYLNNPRMTVGSSCAISGTGFLVSADYIYNNGWKFFTLTEDIEFSINRIADGNLIGYAEDAIVYDEQPTLISQSIRQRSRWVKGSIQVFKKYAGKLSKKVLIDGSFSAFDMVMNTVPAYILTAISIVINTIMFFAGILTRQDMNIQIYSVATTMFNSYIGLAAMGGLTAITERKRINATNGFLVKSVLTFPIYVVSYIVCFVLAVCTNVTWKPIYHKEAVSVEEMKDLLKK